MKVRVDQERCQGHTLCAMITPDMFQLSDFDGTSSAVCDVVPPDQQELVLEAAHSCPEQAIVIELHNNSSVASSGHGVSSRSIT
jgi:ferredoxin